MRVPMHGGYDVDDAFVREPCGKSAGAARGVGEQRRGARIGQRVTQTLIGKCEIEAGVRRAGLHDAELRRVEMRGGARQENGDNALAGDEGREQVCDDIGLTVEFGVRGAVARRAQPPGRDVDGDVVWPVRHRAGKERLKQPRRCSRCHCATNVASLLRDYSMRLLSGATVRCAPTSARSPRQGAMRVPAARARRWSPHGGRRG